MHLKTLIVNALIVNEGTVKKGSILTEGQLIADIFDNPYPESLIDETVSVVDAANSYLLPGIIDTHVHFREPGLTHKGDIASESKAAVAGGITSFMEMPNTLPPATTIKLLEEKFAAAAKSSFANYSFYLGASTDNIDEIKQVDPSGVCGVKVFMGSSTGNMLVNAPEVLYRIFESSPILVAIHCEDEATIQTNLALFKEKYGDQILPAHHPIIRNHRACYISTEYAVNLAKKLNTRLHVLHLSTGDETALFTNKIPLSQKRVTVEACPHHLWFTDEDYHTKGNFIKWNPAIKSQNDKEALWSALIDGTIDVVGTDHAPHLTEEKLKPYLQAPSGGPLIQHSLQIMVDSALERNIPLHQIVQWMCHNPAICFQISRRGYIRKGYFADFVILNPNQKYTVTTENILYKCKWSPFEGHTFKTTPTHTFINGKLVYSHNTIDETFRGMPIEFDR